LDEEAAMVNQEPRVDRAKSFAIRVLWNIRYPPGNYYSPIPSNSEVRRRQAALFTPRRELPGIDFRERAQLELVSQFAAFYEEFPFTDDPAPPLRYHLNNEFFGYGDGVILYSMLRHLRPPKVIEVGSGYSSALMLDVSERFLSGETRFTFIDPHPKRLDSLLNNADRQAHRIIRQQVQDVDEEFFGQLASGDLLFIDSSHVSKVGSDVNFLLLEVLPRLAKGVVVHVHDIFQNFEYPEEWIRKGRAWNEAYLLRALLTSSSDFDILIFNSFLNAFHGREVAELLPLWERDPGGSIWLVRT
jgi:predicted O-methyltransferase YrrM